MTRTHGGVGCPAEAGDDLAHPVDGRAASNGQSQPGREDFRQTLQSAMPRLLTNGHKTPKEEMRGLIDAVKPKALRERLLKVWAKW
jgi:hypothetical protein